MGELEELKKLSPEERIKKLKELEEKRKKEIEEAESMIKESEGEIEEQERIKKDIPIPQVAAPDIDSLFSESEKEIYAAKRGGAAPKAKAEEEPETAVEPEEEIGLEETVARERVEEIQERIQGGAQYFIQNPDKVDEKLSYLKDIKEKGFDLYDSQREQLYSIEEASEKEAAYAANKQEKEHALQAQNEAKSILGYERTFI